MEPQRKGRNAAGCLGVAGSFHALLGVRNLHFERAAAVLEAVRLLGQGAGFADALHHAAGPVLLGRCLPHCSPFRYHRSMKLHRESA